MTEGVAQVVTPANAGIEKCVTPANAGIEKCVTPVNAGIQFREASPRRMPGSRGPSIVGARTAPGFRRAPE
jgi:hypothetical protein